MTTKSFDIPSFVWRGLPRLWRTEADLRDILATEWWLHGADVRTEVKVPDCGRADILVTLAGRMHVIEMKKSITTAGQARDAFQQANSYVQYLAAEHSANQLARIGFPPLVAGYVVADTIEHDAVERAKHAYCDVTPLTLSEALADATWGPYGDQENFRRLLPTARARQNAVRLLLDRLRTAEIEMTTDIEDAALRELAAAS